MEAGLGHPDHHVDASAPIVTLAPNGMDALWKDGRHRARVGAVAVALAGTLAGPGTTHWKGNRP